MNALQLKRDRLPSLGRLAVLTFASAVAFLTVIVPVWAVIVNSFKTIGDSKLLELGLPGVWQIVENYGEVIDQARLGRGLLNSFVATVVPIALVLLFGSMASWVFARSRSRWARLTYLVAIVGILVPPALIPSIAVLKAIGIHGTLLGLIAIYAGSTMAIAVFIITGFVRGIPTELEDAARIDGCSEPAVFFRIVLPLLRPILLSTGIILTIVLWNEFFYAFLIVNDRDSQTLPLGLSYVSSEALFQTRWNYVFAHVVLVSLPLVVSYIVVQRRLLPGLLGGGLKG